MKSPVHERAPKAIDVAAGLVFRAGKLLITQRRLTDHLGGLWEFPGGKVEPGETFHTCLKRELLEELGIEIEVLQEIQDLVHSYPERTVHLKFFQCRWLKGEPSPICCANLAWVTRAELRNFQFPAADVQLLDVLENTPSLWISEFA